MAKTILTDAYVLVGGSNISDHVSKVTVEDNRDSVDVTAFGAVNKAVAKGLGDAKITLEIFQDTAAASIHSILQPLIGSTSTTSVEVRATSAARSATNPAALMQGFLMSYNFLDGSVGDASKITAEFVNGSQTGMTYPTS